MNRQTGPDEKEQNGERAPVEVRATLLALMLEFVLAAREIVGVRRIALLGSLATSKNRPKDADVLVSIDPAAPIEALAQIGRRFQGRAQGINSGADVFLADLDGRYLGRVCHYRACHPRVACRARHCGARPHLADDLDVVSLDNALIIRPPLVLWPSVVATAEVPADVVAILVARLQASTATGASGAAIDGSRTGRCC